jgi:tRNA-specific 2-thiouridylase
MKIAVGLSGGIDSTAAVLRLVDEGHQVVAVFLNMLPEGPYQEKTCCSIDSKLLAKRVARQIGIPFEEWNLQDAFQKNVIDIFSSMTLKGLTPNPCVFCNRYVKIGSFVREALNKGYDAVATGHYARQNEGQLYKGKDEFKDQSYMLSLVNKDVLAHVLFPVGEMTREEVLQYAQSKGISYIPRSSQDICFMPPGGLDEFIEQHLPQATNEGPVILHGEIVGKHRGYARYTIGQRRGLGIGYSEPLYVKEVNPNTNTVYVGTSQELFSNSMKVAIINQFDSITRRAQIRIRYHAPAQEATVEPLEGSLVDVRFDKPVRAITPGQIAVAYEENRVLWAGLILRN